MSTSVWDQALKLPYIQQRIKRVAESFVRDPNVTRKDVRIAETVESARLYKICYCQDVQELRADYNEYVYDNSFARRKRRQRD